MDGATFLTVQERVVKAPREALGDEGAGRKIRELTADASDYRSPEGRASLAARALRELAPAELARLGVEGRRAAALREVGWRAARLDAAVDANPSELERMLAALPGLGPWTIQSLLLHGLGNPDAVPLGDLHLPHLVAWNLAREASGDDARMLELLSPWAGQRGRVLRWLLVAGERSPRAGPRRDALTGRTPGPARARSELRLPGPAGSRGPDWR